jgi:O-antigen/teichoic acid export membrane protein
MHVNWTMADQAVVSGVNFLTGLVLARCLGISEFGIFSLTWVVVLFVFSLQYAMVSAPMLSIATKIEDSGRPTYFGSVVLQHVLFTAVSAILVWLGVTTSGHVFPDLGLDSYALPLMATTVAFQTRDFLRRMFYASDRHVAAFLLDVVGYGGQLAALVAMFVIGTLDIISALWTIAAISSLAIVGAAFGIGRLRFCPRDFVAVARRHWQFSRWLAASALSNLFVDHFLLVLSGAFIGPAAAGAMKAAQNLMGIAQLMFFALENIVPARAAWHFHNGGIDALTEFMKRVTNWSVAATALVVTLFATHPEFWLQLIFGDEFVGYGILVRLYGACFLLKSFGFAFVAGLHALEDTRPIFVACCSAAALAFAVTYPLLAQFGVTGAAAGAVIVEALVVSSIISGFLVRAQRLRRRHVVGTVSS